jgi:cholesterol transport system auxiliary component
MIRFLILAPVLVLGGCISLLPAAPPPPRIFVLDAGEVTPLATPSSDAVVGVALPTGERSILNTDMVWRTGDELAFVAQSQWSNRADLALQSILVETLARQHAFAAVTRAGEARGDFELRWEVLDFEVAQDTMQARFVADVKLLSMPGRRVVAQQIIEANAPVNDRASSVAAQALARAAREGSARIGEFVASNAAQASAASISR